MGDDLQDLTSLPSSFSGDVRLFPLPNLVMFPHVMQPFHIFEPRYREMLEDALRTDRLIAMALLQPGWELNYEGRPPVHPVICLGRVVSHVLESDGRYNLLLMGMRRATIERELPPLRSYREVKVGLLADVLPTESAARRARLQQELLETFRDSAPHWSEFEKQFDQLLSRSIPLGVLTDIVAFSMELDLPFKQLLLSEADIDRRARLLLERLVADKQDDSKSGRGRTEPRRFPPDFSDN